MTSTAHPVGSSIRDALGAPSLRRSLTAMVRRKVPGSDAEDVAQTVLCDALAAPGIPSDPEDLRRFVAGIARHKVADFHRGARRRGAREPSPSGDHEPSAPEIAVAPAPLEARALLARIADSVAASSSPREQETLEWLVREHAGEELKAIADESGVPAPAVRQRVSRLRRVLRAQWGHALALLLIAGTCTAVAAHRREDAGIFADPAGDPVALATLPLNGAWRVDTLAPAAGTDAKTSLEANMVDVRIKGRMVSILTPTRTLTRTIGMATRRADGSIAIDLLGDDAGVQHLTAILDDDGGLELTVHDGRLQGHARLVKK